MARSLRIEFAGALYHVVSRGDRQEAVYKKTKIARCFFALWRRRSNGSTESRLSSSWSGLRQQIYLGDDTFVAKVQKKARYRQIS
jgi:hypothetical protein